jgi:hypothetical protein
MTERGREGERGERERGREKFLGLPGIQEHIFGNKCLVSKFWI